MRILRRGDTGGDVKIAQTALTRAGYDPGPIDGVFGKQMESAVIQFQSAMNIKQDGIIGPITWKYLEPYMNESSPEVLQIGSRGEAVMILQKALKTSGNDPGAIDGIFGTKTQTALKAFQKAAGIPETGATDAIAWLALSPYLDYTNVQLKRGSTGMYVAILQAALINACQSPGGIDGNFGTKTQAAVVAFQKAKSLSPDGIVGPLTWAALKPYITGKIVPHTVVQGDTLETIAQTYHTTVSDILELNPRESTQLYPGEILYIPMNGCATATSNGTGTGVTATGLKGTEVTGASLKTPEVLGTNLKTPEVTGGNITGTGVTGSKGVVSGVARSSVISNAGTGVTGNTVMGTGDATSPCPSVCGPFC